MDKKAKDTAKANLAKGGNGKLVETVANSGKRHTQIPSIAKATKPGRRPMKQREDESATKLTTGIDPDSNEGPEEGKGRGKGKTQGLTLFKAKKKWLD